VEYLGALPSAIPLKERQLALPTNFRTGLKVLPGTNTLAYFCYVISDEEKSSKTLTPGPNVLKLFSSVIYECS
jgi:hypothetical protein